jgi:hypothetical protein
MEGKEMKYTQLLEILLSGIATVCTLTINNIMDCGGAANSNNSNKDFVSVC